MLNLDRLESPTPLSSHVASHSAVMFALFSVPTCVMAGRTTLHARIMLGLMLLKLGVCLLVMVRQPSDTRSLTFKVPAGEIYIDTQILLVKDYHESTIVSWLVQRFYPGTQYT